VLSMNPLSDGLIPGTFSGLDNLLNLEIGFAGLKDLQVGTFYGLKTLNQLFISVVFNAGGIKCIFSELEQQENERCARESRLKQQEREERKQGPPEDMTIVLLKEVLDGLNITYKSISKKAELILKVKQARGAASLNACPTNPSRIKILNVRPPYRTNLTVCGF
ncbi:hypothetical protein AC249_AIPGENE17876, partial [Exaiptasia diaphana]